MRRVLLKYLIYSLFSLQIVFAGTTGKISGVVQDNNGEPLIGVNVVLKETLLGASTDIDGNFVILNIPPGTYSLEFSYIGYQTLEKTSVRVSIDLTTQINATMVEEGLVSETIVVVAERPLLTKDLTSSTAIVNSEQISALPVTEISEVLNLQGGMVDGHARGGRKGEVAYWIDGIPVTDAYDGGQVVEVNKDMVEELQFISGAFNAEYGQAMSGIVNITTKEPREPIKANLNVYAGDYLSSHNDIYWNVNNFDPSNIYNIDGGISGVIVPRVLSFYLNGRYIYYGGWLFGKREYNPWNISYKDSADNWVLARDENGLGDGEYVPMNWNRKIYGQAKLIYNVLPTLKLSYNFLYDDVNFEEYDRNYRLNPDGNLNKFRTGTTHLLKVTHTLSNSTYYDIGFSLFQKDYKQYVYEDKNNPNWVHPRVGSSIPSYNFKTGGMSNQYFHRSTNTALLKFDLSSQLSAQHFFKAGLEVRRYDIAFDEYFLQPVRPDLNLETDSPFMTVDLSRSEVGSFYRNKYTHNPEEYSAYIQDKMEFEDIIVNLGVRFDYFRPDGKILADPSDPDVYFPTRPINFFRDLDGNGIITDDEWDVVNNSYSLQERKKFWYKEASNKTKISPRLGVSFPVTETGIVHFSYGHFFQIPNFEYLYRNPQFKLTEESENKGLIGNADLKPEQTISGEIGLQQQIGSDLSMDVTAFFRDVRDLVGSRAEEIQLFTGDKYSKLVNSDFGFIKGIIISLKNRYHLGLNYTVDYTFQIATGTSSDPNQARNALASGNLPEVQLVPLGWDQRHTLNSTLSYIQQDWGISFIGTLGSGLPYTPRQLTDVSSLKENSETKPVAWNVDVRFHKNFNLMGIDFVYFIRIQNLFDHLNETNVYNDTGKAGYTTDLERIRSLNPDMPVNTLDDWFTNETYYSEPRRIETGFSISL